jgi:hypothetical protein
MVILIRLLRVVFLMSQTEGKEVELHINMFASHLIIL